MLTIAVGGNHACGINSTGFLICRGKNDYGKIDVPDHSPFEFSALALGLNHTCALRRLNSYVVCWGGGGGNSNSNSHSDYPVGVLFESIVAGIDFTCGLTSNNLSVVCWGEGWVRTGLYRLGFELPLTTILPGPCVRSGCQCGTYIQSDSLCPGFGLICRPCDITTLLPPNPPLLAPPSAGICSNIPSSSPSRSLRRGLLVYAIVGSVGAFAVDYAVPVITSCELVKILDKRVGQPEVNEAEAVELMAYTAMHCVNLEGRERPTMSDIVANLERAVSLCDDSHGSISSGQISIISE
ncbi:hypothetical protein L1987_35268 [Smallanthus sonchifolius]|uniref:Uncharacterized protein n=1 Tax=Smallanthus sonchifolius TaxID=185202 RepID=A0ACB9HYT1_9ASTR|nr:hypothetical protein L1987_35268 [Smallanthus sonchifolius]